MTDALQLIDVCKSFGRTRIFERVNLSVPAGERHAVIGPNGAGKSTLFHLLSGKLAPSSGSIQLFGQEIAGAPPARIFATGLARNFQINSLFNTMSARENLRCAALVETGNFRALWRRAATVPDLSGKVSEMLDRIGLDRRGDIPCDQLSYSEQRAIEIGMAVISGRKVILLDEPTAGMNHAETDRFIDLIQCLTEGRTLMIVEHDMGVVFSLADRITVLAAGGIVASGAPDTVRGNAEVRHAYLGQRSASNGEGAEC